MAAEVAEAATEVEVEVVAEEVEGVEGVSPAPTVLLWVAPVAGRCLPPTLDGAFLSARIARGRFRFLWHVVPGFEKSHKDWHVAFALCSLFSLRA